LERKVKELETKIERLEKEAAEVIADLETASLAGDGEAIAANSRRNEQLNAEIEATFEDLDHAAKVCEEAAREYDIQLDELSGGL
jgi:hypothetical protein